MNQETITFWIGAWGAITGTLALVIEYIAYRHDRSRLLVNVTMAYGGDMRFGRESHHFLVVQLTNGGKGIIRIRRFAVAYHRPASYRVRRLLERFRPRHNIKPLELGIYSASVDPIDDILANPNVKTYPPKNIFLEDHETKEVRVTFPEEMLSILPKNKGLLIVTDHVGRKHYATFIPIHVQQKESEANKAVKVQTPAAVV